eukprot:198758_1
MEVCKAIDSKKRSCWIGLHNKNGFKKWNDGIKADSKFANWAPGEPNQYQNDEDCVELYSQNGKWNDITCRVKRFFLCNVQNRLQRMNTKIRKKK